MKIVIITMTQEEYRLCGGLYSGTYKCFSGIDGGELVEENGYFLGTFSANIPLQGGAYFIEITFGILGRKLYRIKKDGQEVPLHQVVMTNSANNIIIYDEHS
jgi:hypothetical protein